MGFTGNDGSALIGGLNPSNIAQAAIVDAQGRFIISPNAVANPFITEDQIRAYTLAGQAFSATTGKNTAPGGSTLGFQLFNPASSGKGILIYSLIVLAAASGIHDIRVTTADVSTITGWTNSVITPQNNKGGGVASVATCSFSNTNVTGALLGTSREFTAQGANVAVETLTNGESIWLPAGASINGIAVYYNATGANPWAITAGYLEF